MTLLFHQFKVSFYSEGVNMNQPELGNLIAEKRQSMGLTQEQLAELCDVSTRTIQRLETGEVVPRAFTRNNLSTALEFDFGAEPDGNELFWLTVLHLSSCICIFFVPLLIWSWKKQSSSKIAKHGQQVLNFQITMTLVLVSAGLMMLIIPPLILIFMQSLDGPIRLLNLAILLITIIPMIVTGIFCFIEGIVNTIRMHSDKPVHYPLSIKFIK
jgi:uncharacterized Tic20 family protein